MSAATPALPDWLEPMGGGVYAIDTGFQRPRFDAAWLLVEGGQAAFIDTGTNHSVPRLLGALQALGLTPEAVAAVIPTHVHLDHAGGVGLLMQHCPRATCWVHPRGQRHLVDPSALYKGALAVYGQAEMDRHYGQLLPVAAERVQATHDGQVLTLAGRPLVVADTPGHARHHHCLWDEATRGWFTGDTFGLSYREFDTARGPWVLASSTPVQFEPEALKASIDRLLATDPQWMYLTHYARVGDAARLAAILHRQIDAMVALGLRLKGADDRHARLVQGLEDLCRTELTAHGVADTDAGLAGLALDIELNAQGLGVWLGRDG